MKIFRTLRYLWLLEQAKDMAHELDRWSCFGSVNQDQRDERDGLQQKIVDLQHQLKEVAPFNALLKEWFPEIAVDKAWKQAKLKRPKIKV